MYDQQKPQTSSHTSPGMHPPIHKQCPHETSPAEATMTSDLTPPVSLDKLIPDSLHKHVSPQELKGQ